MLEDLQQMLAIDLKICQEGYYSYLNDTLGYYTCLSCDSSCKSCIGAFANNCTDCNNPLKLLQAEMTCILVESCPESYYQDSETGLCTPCTASCLICINFPDQCPICKKGYFREY